MRVGASMMYATERVETIHLLFLFNCRLKSEKVKRYTFSLYPVQFALPQLKKFHFNKKLLPKYRGPYVVKRVLDNDRYIVCDPEDEQLTQLPFEGVCTGKHETLGTRRM